MSRQYAGNSSSGTFQDTIATFDGHGRLASSHRPEQRDSSNDPAFTTYNYNADDSISSVTDARGAVKSYTYNTRGLVTEINHSVPQQSGIPLASDVEFEYDDLGNRTEMEDGMGKVVYEYNSLSQLISETREFNDTLEDAPLPDNSFKLQYTYTMGGQLKSYTDPYGDAIYYAFDKTARLDAVTGSSFDGITSYASNPGYRAWGGLKHLEYGNGIEMSMTFNNRLQADQFELKKDTTEIMKKNYEYLSDGRLRYTEDELNGVFDRLQTYDHQGRLKEGKSGAEARGQTVDPEDMNTELPYRQSYGFNAFNNLTQRNNLHWGTDQLPYSGSFNLNYTYENNRVTNQNWVHDADGRVKQSSAPDEWGIYTYDARGQMVRSYAGANIVDIRRFYNGDGREAKRERTVWVDDEINYPQPPYGYWHEEDNVYYIRSTVLGGEVVSETGPTGKKKKTFVYAAGAKIATQTEHVYESTTYKSVSFHHADSSGLSQRTAHSNGTVYNFGGNYDGAPVEVDGAWQPAGDDYTRGWLWTFQKYDWMGRVIRKIATDGDPQQSANDSDVFSPHECRDETYQIRISPGGSRSQPLDRKRAMQK